MNAMWIIVPRMKDGSDYGVLEDGKVIVKSGEDVQSKNMVVSGVWFKDTRTTMKWEVFHKLCTEKAIDPFLQLNNKPIAHLIINGRKTIAPIIKLDAVVGTQ